VAIVVGVGLKDQLRTMRVSRNEHMALPDSIQDVFFSGLELGDIDPGGGVTKAMGMEWGGWGYRVDVASPHGDYPSSLAKE